MSRDPAHEALGAGDMAQIIQEAVREAREQTLFGTDAPAQAQKTACAEATGREDFAMPNVQRIDRVDNSEGSVVARAVGPLSYIRDGNVFLSAADAGAVLRLCRYERQTRDLKPGGAAHIEVLADIMRRKQWRKRNQINFASFEGRLILMDGHHRLTAQEKSGESIEWAVVVHECRSADDIARVYCTFNVNDRGRTNENLLAAMNAAEILGVTKTTAEALYRTVPVFIANFDFSRSAQDVVTNRVVDRRMEVMHTYAAEGRAWEAACKKAPGLVKRKLLNQGALAVALTAFRYRPVEAEGFYRGIAENDGLRKGDPRRTYLTALTTGTSSGQAAFTARQAAVAWNAYVERRDLTILKIVEANAFRISGTPVGR